MFALSKIKARVLELGRWVQPGGVENDCIAGTTSKRPIWYRLNKVAAINRRKPEHEGQRSVRVFLKLWMSPGFYLLTIYLSLILAKEKYLSILGTAIRFQFDSVNNGILRGFSWRRIARQGLATFTRPAFRTPITAVRSDAVCPEGSSIAHRDFGKPNPWKGCKSSLGQPFCSSFHPLR